MTNNYNFDKELFKLGKEKIYDDTTWEDIRDVLNAAYNLSFSESFYRKRFKVMLEEGINTEKQFEVPNIEVQQNQAKNEDYAKTEKSNSNNLTNNLSELLREIRKEKAKLSDERTQNGAYVRAMAREETLKEIAAEAVKNMSSKKILDKLDSDYVSIGTNEAILVISDWHYGLVCDNAWNKFNPEIAEQRLLKLKYNVIRHCTDNDVSKLYVLNLSDLICGRIHLPLRLESRFDVITQTMKVSEILAEFLNDLSAYFDIDYYDCEDNHSRIEPNKSDSLHVENFTRIIKWYLNSRLEGNNNIRVHTENTYSEDIITFNCNGYRFAAVHGDKDRLSDVVENISMMTHEYYDAIFTSHLHHFAADEINETVVLQNGALVGTDRYAASIRKSAVPSQTLVIVSESNPTEAIYRIILD